MRYKDKVLIYFTVVGASLLGLMLILAFNFNTNMSSNKYVAVEAPLSNSSVAPTVEPPKANSENKIIVAPTSTLKTIVKPAIVPPVAKSNKPLLWGAYVGDMSNSLTKFETLVGKPVNYYADFEGWNNNFPLNFATDIGAKGKTLIIFWEPNFGYDSILDKSHDAYIEKFAADAKKYGYPVILVPFVEMNLNEEAWGYDNNGNTAEKFKLAWKHVHDLFDGASNVKFGLAYNNTSIPNVSGNLIKDYYPGSSYVDYVGVDGFNFTDPGNTFAEIFDEPMKQLASYNKPIIIFSMGAIAGPNKAQWIAKGLGDHVKTYKNLIGWVWFNQNGFENWLINSDDASLSAFKKVVP